MIAIWGEIETVLTKKSAAQLECHAAEKMDCI
jgi:hypothetical protein